MKPSNSNVLDNIETLILLALEANHEHQVDKTGGDFRGQRYAIDDQGSLLKLRPMLPSTCYTFDSSDPERIFTTSKDYLLKHPADVLGDSAEILMFTDKGYLKWHGYKRAERPPRGVSTLGKAEVWYESHTRLVGVGGGGLYVCRMIPFNAKGDPLPAKVQGHACCTPELEGVGAVLAASVIEDAHRVGSMLAEVSDAKTIKFPIPLGDYKEVFAMRDGPFNGNRRKSIIHWVAQHLRRIPGRTSVKVSAHTRGVQEFKVDGLSVRLTPNP